VYCVDSLVGVDKIGCKLKERAGSGIAEARGQAQRARRLYLHVHGLGGGGAVRQPHKSHCWEKLVAFFFF